MTRRKLLIYLMGFVALPAATARGKSVPAGEGKVVIVDGWVLLEDDLRRLGAHVA